MVGWKRREERAKRRLAIQLVKRLARCRTRLKIKWRGKGVEFTEIVPQSPVYLDRDCTPSLSFSLPHLSIPFHSDFRAFVNVVPLSLSLSRQKSSSPESTHKIKLDAVDRFNAVGLTFHRELCSSRARSKRERTTR